MSSHHRITRLRVTGGFLANADLHLSDGLNCFIGARGTGKTTALEFLRFGLGLLPDAKIYPQRRRSLEALIDTNLTGGRLAIDVATKGGMNYLAERGRGDGITVKNARSEIVPISLDRDEIFSADVFSQNEIEEIASNAEAQLELLDRFDEPATRRFTRELDELGRSLTASGAELRRLDEEIEGLRARVAEVSGIEERLRGLTQPIGPDGERLALAHTAKARRLREVRVPELVLTAVQRAAREVAATSSSFRAAIDSAFDDELSKGENAVLMAAVREVAQRFADSLRDAGDSVSTAARRTERSVDEHQRTLAILHAGQDAEYGTVISASQEHAEKTRERDVLQTALAAAQEATRDLQSLSATRVTSINARNALLARLSELRDERYSRRRAVAAQLSSEIPTLRVSIRQAANTDEYREFVAEQLKGQRIKHGVAADRIVASLLPTELAAIVFSQATEELAERVGIDGERARRIIDTLEEDGRAYELQTLDLGDVPCIELRDGDIYKEASHLSTGQRCTVVLPILLRQSDRPLLIDQPEDNLDNAFVFETVVGALRVVKLTRQVVFVTHNPNIPVLGDADRVFVFDSDGRKARVVESGTVDECKQAVERILEGGATAFLERMKRYGH